MSKLKLSPEVDLVDHPETKRSILTSVDALTLAISNLTTKLDMFMSLQQKAIPYPLVLIMFLIIIGTIFGIGALRKFELIQKLPI